MEKEKAAEIVEVQKESLPAVRSDPESLIAMAIQNNVNVDSLERLLKMRSDFRAEQARELYYSQLAAFQRVCPSIPKTEKVRNQDGTVRYSYASLDSIVEAVKDQLGAHGFSYRFEVLQAQETVTVICELIHQSGHKEQTSMTVPIDPKAFMNAPQKVASAITYGKRYTFTNATGILTGDEDDDARSADDLSKTQAKKPSTTPPAAKPAQQAAKPAAAPARPTQMINMNKKYMLEATKLMELSENGILKLTQKAETLTGSEYLLELKKFMNGYIKSRVDAKVFTQEQVDFALTEYKVLSFLDLKYEDALAILKELSARFNPTPVTPPAGLQ